MLKPFDFNSPLEKEEWFSYVEGYGKDLLTRIAVLQAMLFEQRITEAVEKAQLKEGWGKVANSYSPAVSTALYYAFLDKKTNRDGIKSILSVLGLRAEEEQLAFATSLNLEVVDFAAGAYLLAIFGKEVNTANIMAIAKAMQVEKVDEKIAAWVVDAYNKAQATDEQSKLTGNIEGDFQIMLKTNEFLGWDLGLQLHRVIRQIFIPMNMKRKLLPYIWLMGGLYMAGKDASILPRETWKLMMNDVFKVLGSDFESGSIDFIFNIIKVGVVAVTLYIPAVYLLRSLGREPTTENLMEIVSASGIHPDSTPAGYVLTLYRDYSVH